MYHLFLLQNLYMQYAKKLNLKKHSVFSIESEEAAG